MPNPQQVGEAIAEAAAVALVHQVERIERAGTDVFEQLAAANPRLVDGMERARELLARFSRTRARR